MPGVGAVGGLRRASGTPTTSRCCRGNVPSAAAVADRESPDLPQVLPRFLLSSGRPLNQPISSAVAQPSLSFPSHSVVPLVGTCS